MTAYTAQFFKNIESQSRQSAQRVVPCVLDLIHPSSIVDVGCGTGEWLAVFSQWGITDYLGIDGEYVDRSQLVIPRDRFVACVLPHFPKQDRTFDLVLSLEVAEHLPPSAASSFVEGLTDLGPIVLFSAAIPGQGGNRHLNEQWPNYWAQRFESHGYVVVDILREQFWRDSEVAWFYAQNMFLYIARDHLSRFPHLHERIVSGEDIRPLVHPELHLIHASGIPRRLGSVVGAIPGLLRTSARLHMRSLLARLGVTRRNLDEQEDS